MDRAGIGQSELKRATGVSQASISRFSDGTTSELTPKNATALAKHFGVPVVALLDDAEADACARRLALTAPSFAVVAEASPEYAIKQGWPFSADLWHEVSKLDPHQMAKLESLMRVHLDLAPAGPSAVKGQRVANG